MILSLATLVLLTLYFINLSVIPQTGHWNLKADTMFSHPHQPGADLSGAPQSLCVKMMSNKVWLQLINIC
jgi:hypothetical protein